MAKSEPVRITVVDGTVIYSFTIFIKDRAGP